jgi:hypothetical protein
MTFPHPELTTGINGLVAWLQDIIDGFPDKERE